MKKDFELSEIERYIQSVVLDFENRLDKDVIAEINHYLKHEEYEIAYEGLFLEIMKLKPMPSIDWTKSKHIAKLLNLDKESVLDDRFWAKISEFN